MVDRLFREAGLSPLSVRLGEVQLADPPTTSELAALQPRLQEFGFELLNDQKSRIIEKIKTTIIEYIQDGVAADQGAPVFSEFLGSALHREYSALSKLFSEVEGLTIEKYLIRQKIEKVKEWLVYDELSLSEIADRLGYSGVAHLSGQFKKTTGFTPTEFRKSKDHHRRPLDEIGGR
jgi:YesN/AraC family two-component response regulator